MITELMNIRHKGDPCELCGLTVEETGVDECLGAIIEHIRDIKVEIAFPMAQLESLTNKAKAHARLYSAVTGESGTLLDLDGVQVRVVYPKKPRVTYDTKALDILSDTIPTLLKYRKEKMAAPSVSIKVD